MASAPPIRVCLWHDDCDCSYGYLPYPNFPIWRLAERDGWQCAYCYRPARPHAVREHVYPRSRGGSDSITNLVIACASCNARKSNLTIDEWLFREQDRGLLHELPGLRTMAREYYDIEHCPESDEPTAFGDSRFMQWAINEIRCH